MRWQQLFADLQAQFDAEESAAERSETASRVRAEIGALRLAERLGGAVGFPVALGCRGAGAVTGVLTHVGVDWLLLDGGGGRDDLIALRSVRTVGGLRRRTAVSQPAEAVWSRLDLRRALRGLARDRAVVQVILDDGATLTGTLDRVGADYVELAEHPADQPRRSGVVHGVRAVVLEAIAVVRTVPPGLG
jgi:hypothetical protein